MRSEGSDLDRLKRELQSTAYRLLLGRLHGAHPFLRQFQTWAEVLAFMWSGTSADPRKDGVLRPVFEAYAEDQDPRWRVVLLAVFWPGLRSILRKKRRWDMEDPDELWQRIAWTFLQAVCRLDVRRRPDRLAQKIINDTYHRLYEEYRRDWDRTSLEVRPAPKDPEDLDSPESFDVLVGGVEDINFAEIELREVQELEFKRLREHLVAGRISEPDFLLLVGTRIYGQSVADYAREAGLDYQVAKKRRQRAEAAIRGFEDSKLGAATGCPHGRPLPPFPDRGPASHGRRER
jgi:hypothetical protein